MKFVSNQTILPRTFEESVFLKESILRRIEELEDLLLDPDLVYSFYPRNEYQLWRIEASIKLAIYQKRLQDVLLHLQTFEEYISWGEHDTFYFED